MNIKKVSILLIPIFIVTSVLLVTLYRFDHDTVNVEALKKFVETETQLLYGRNSYVSREDTVSAILAEHKAYRANVENVPNTLISDIEDYEEYLNTYNSDQYYASAPILHYIDATIFNDVPAVIDENSEDYYEILYKALRNEGIQNYYVNIQYEWVFSLYKYSILFSIILFFIWIADISLVTSALVTWYMSLLTKKGKQK